MFNRVGFELAEIESIMLLLHGSWQPHNGKVSMEPTCTIAASSNDNSSTSMDVMIKAKWDPYLAPCTRARPPGEWSLKDIEWITIDRILNPQLWDKQQRFSSIIRPDPSNDDLDDNEASIAEVLKIPQRALCGNISSAKAVVRRERPLGKWKCPFTTKEQIISIWKKENLDLMDVDERRCHNLLIEYNGQYSASCYDCSSEGLQKSQRLFFGSKWDRNSYFMESNVCNRSSALLEDDLWQRCRVLHRELDRAFLCTSPFMECSLLHAVPQRFPTPILRHELERELNKTLLELLYCKENVNSFSFFADMKGLEIEQGCGKAACDLVPNRQHEDACADEKGTDILLTPL